MTYSARCPQCGVRIDISPEEIDRKIRCVECDNVFVAPVTGIMAGVTTDGFWVKRRVSGGSVSEIFEAQKIATGQKLLLKVICPAMSVDSEALDAYLAWIDRARDVNLPNFVASVETGKIMDHLYIAYPLVSGTCLDAYLENHGPMPEKDVLKTGLKIARLLDNAWSEHAALHLSLKPSNILLDADKQIFLLDPGHFRLLLPLSDPSLQRLAGWPPYGFAPEQISGQTELDHRADMYALGASLFQLATGKPPFDGDDVAEVYGHHLQTPPPAASSVVSGISTRFDEVVQTLMAKNRDDRYNSWDDAAKALKAATKGSKRSTTATKLNLIAPKLETGTGANLNVSGRHIPAPLPPQKEGKGGLIAIGILVVAILAVVAGVLFSRLNSQPATTPPPEIVAPTPASDPKLKAIADLYDQAVAYSEANPTDFDGAIKRFRDVRTAGLNTEYQQKAHQQIQLLIKARERAATPASTPPPEGEAAPEAPDDATDAPPAETP